MSNTKYIVEHFVIWFLSFKKSEVPILTLCKENESTNFAIAICQ